MRGASLKSAPERAVRAEASERDRAATIRPSAHFFLCSSHFCSLAFFAEKGRKERRKEVPFSGLSRIAAFSPAIFPPLSPRPLFPLSARSDGETTKLSNVEIDLGRRRRQCTTLTLPLHLVVQDRFRSIYRDGLKNGP